MRSVYVIEIDPKWVSVVRPRFDPDVVTFYVGQTQKDVGKRFREHRRGIHPRDDPGSAAAKIFRDIHQARLDAGLHGTLVKNQDAWVRWDLINEMDLFEVPDSEVLAVELATAEALRSQGFQVEGPKS